MNVPDARFRPAEHLKSREAISALFRGGAYTAKAYPLRLVYRFRESGPPQPPVRIGFVASKRAFRHAHDRNHVKRRMREAFRLHKQVLHRALGSHEGTAIDAMLLFTGRELPTQAQITRAWLKLLTKFEAPPPPSPQRVLP